MIAGAEMEREMDQEDMNNGMPDMESDNGGMRHHISRKAGPPGELIPTTPVRDLIHSDHHEMENSEDLQQVETRGKIRRSK